MNEFIKILLIEDNPADARLIDVILREASPSGFNVIRAETLGEALKKLDGEKFDAILSDLGLPDSMGLETVTGLREKKADTPIVVLTSLDDEKTAMEAVHEGAQDYIVKGKVDGGTFARSIKYAIERHKLQKEINDMREEFVATLTHDLKSPLVSIMGFASLITDPNYGDISKDKAGYAGNILYSSKFMLNIINNIIESSRIELGQFNIDKENFELSELLEEIKETFAPRIIMKKIGLNIECLENITVYADINKIRQVFHNLISNAFKFTPEGGAITVSVVQKDGFAEVTVSDTGRGIPEDMREHIFEKFFQAKGERRGSGLGLYITKKILEAHGSGIRLKNRPGEGAKFVFSLHKK